MIGLMFGAAGIVALLFVFMGIRGKKTEKRINRDLSRLKRYDEGTENSPAQEQKFRRELAERMEQQKIDLIQKYVSGEANIPDELINAVESRGGALRDKLLEMQEDNNELRSQVKAYEEGLQKIVQNSNAALDEATNEYNDLAAKYNELADDYSALADEKDNAAKKIEELERLNATVSEVGAEVDSKLRMEMAEETSVKLRQAYSDIASLEELKVSLESELEETKKALAAIKFELDTFKENEGKDIASAQSKITEELTAKFEQEKEELRKEITEKLTSEKEQALEQQRIEHEAKQEVLTRRAEGAESQVDGLKREVADLDAALRHAEDKNSSLEIEYRTLKQDKAIADSELRANTKELESALAKAAGLKNERDELIKEANSLKEKLGAFEAGRVPEQTGLKESGLATGAAAAGLGMTAGAVMSGQEESSDIKELMDRIAMLERDNAGLREALDTKEQSIRDLSGSLNRESDDKHSEVARHLQAQIDKRDDKIAELEAKLKDAEHKLANRYVGGAVRQQEAPVQQAGQTQQQAAPQAQGVAPGQQQGGYAGAVASMIGQMMSAQVPQGGYAGVPGGAPVPDGQVESGVQAPQGGFASAPVQAAQHVVSGGQAPAVHQSEIPSASRGQEQAVMNDGLGGFDTPARTVSVGRSVSEIVEGVLSNIQGEQTLTPQGGQAPVAQQGTEQATVAQQGGQVIQQVAAPVGMGGMGGFGTPGVDAGMVPQSPGGFEGAAQAPVGGQGAAQLGVVYTMVSGGAAQGGPVSSIKDEQAEGEQTEDAEVVQQSTGVRSSTAGIEGFGSFDRYNEARHAFEKLSAENNSLRQEKDKLEQELKDALDPANASELERKRLEQVQAVADGYKEEMLKLQKELERIQKELEEREAALAEEARKGASGEGSGEGSAGSGSAAGSMPGGSGEGKSDVPNISDGKDSAALLSELNYEQQRNRALQDKARELEEMLRDLRSRMAARDTEMRKKEEELAELLKELQHLKKKQEEMKTEISAQKLRSDNASFKADYEEELLKREEAERTIAKLEEELAKLREEKEYLERELSHQQSEVSRLQAIIDNSGREVKIVEERDLNIAIEDENAKPKERKVTSTAARVNTITEEEYLTLKAKMDNREQLTILELAKVKKYEKMQRHNEG